MTTITVLTSRENLVWQNMQEIIPYIESCWKAMNPAEYEVQILNIDHLTVADLTPEFLRSRKIVITCFNYRMCKMMQYIREVLRLNVGFVVYTHSMPSQAFWPYRYFGSDELFMKSDLFVTPSERDKKMIEAVFVKPLVYVIPFFSELKKSFQPKVQADHVQNIIYLGRISPQKNLHNLILAYSLLKNKVKAELPKLTFFGQEDHYGSPHMNIRCDDYLDFLNALIENLQLGDSVFLKGHVEKELIEFFLTEKTNLVVLPSLHSEENFGLSALQSILSANFTLLSDWGGHVDFKKHFDASVDLMSVWPSEYGPALGAHTIFQHLEKNILNYSTAIKPDLNSFYKPDYFLKEQEKIVSNNHLPLVLKYSDLGNAIYESKLDFTNSTTQLYSGFNDTHFLTLSKNYLNELQLFELPKAHNYKAVPWMKFQDNNFIINDPHKGNLVIPNDQSLTKTYQVQMNQNHFIPTSKETVERLFKNGFIYPLEQ